MISMLIASVALGAGLAAEADARVLAYEGTLTLEFVQPGFSEFTLTGVGVATVNGSAGRIPLSSLRLAGGISGFDTVPLTDPDLSPIRSIAVDLSLGTGVLAPISGGAVPLTRGTLPIQGDLLIAILFPIPFSIPLTIGGTRGAGIGAFATINTFGSVGLQISVEGAPWTIGATTVSSSVRSGFAHGPVSGTTTTAKEGGVV